MSKSFTDQENTNFSPLVFSTTLFFTYMGLFFLTMQSSYTVPWWLWLFGIPVVGLGAALEILTRRLLWIRIYQLLVTLLMAVPFVIYLWLILTKNYLWPGKLFTLIMLTFILLGATVIVSGITRKQANLTQMPHGTIGLLNPKTGYVDPTTSPKYVQKNLEESNSRVKQIGRLTPLFAGLSMFLVQVLGDSEIDVLLAVVAMIPLCAGIVGAIGSGRYALSIRRWEQQHGKNIYVQK